MTFSLGAVLSVITGRLLTEMSEVQALLDHMTGDVLFTHQIPRAMDECQPHLRRQHPDLAALAVPEFDGERHVRLWVQGQVATFGTQRDVEPLPEGVHVYRDPIAELVEKMGGAS